MPSNAPVVLAGNLTVTTSGANPWTLSFGTAGSIGGDYSLTMSGTGGTLILSGSNTYSGGTFVLDGSLIASDNEALADGSSLIVGSAALADFAPLLSADASPTATVPEPSALGLAAAGIALVFARRVVGLTGKPC